MAYKSVRMDTIEKIREFNHRGFGKKRIARLLGISKNTVKKYLGRITDLGLDCSKEFSSEQIAKIYSDHWQQSSSRHKELEALLPDIRKELERVGVTRELLWNEYIEQHPQGYSYGQFCRLLKQFLARKNATLGLHHEPAKVLQVDFAGSPLPYYDAESGKRYKAEVLVCTLPFSGLVFVIALPSQKQEHFVEGLNQALLYIGGVPRGILGDNFKSYVIKPDRYSPTFNDLCRQLSAHYAMELHATRVGKPRDKGHVERHVQIVYQNIYAPLRNERFYSIEQINTSILNQLSQLNNKKRQSTKISRQQKFDQDEKPYLQTLPCSLFDIKKSTRAKVHSNYHVILGEDKHQYSVPYQYIGQYTEVVYNRSTVEVYIGSQRIAVHQRDRAPHTWTTLASHRPEKHRKYLETSENTSENLIEKAQAIGPDTLWAVQYVMQQQVGLALQHKAALNVLNLAKKYSTQRLETACQLSRTAGTVTCLILKNILSNNTDKAEHISDTRPIPNHDNIRGPSCYL